MFTPNTSGQADALFGRFANTNGRVLANLVCRRAAGHQSVMHVDVQLYDGSHRKHTAHFELVFVQDFKNYTDQFIKMQADQHNIDISTYRYFHRYSSAAYRANSTFKRHFNQDKSVIEVDGSQRQFDGKLTLDLNPIYLGAIRSLDINFEISIVLFTSLCSMFVISFEL